MRLCRSIAMPCLTALPSISCAIRSTASRSAAGQSPSTATVSAMRWSVAPSNATIPSPSARSRSASGAGVASNNWSATAAARTIRASSRAASCRPCGVRCRSGSRVISPIPRCGAFLVSCCNWRSSRSVSAPERSILRRRPICDAVRRLRAQAVPAARAGGAHPRGAAPRAAPLTGRSSTGSNARSRPRPTWCASCRCSPRWTARPRCRAASAWTWRPSSRRRSTTPPSNGRPVRTASGSPRGRAAHHPGRCRGAAARGGERAAERAVLHARRD